MVTKYLSAFKSLATAAFNYRPKPKTVANFLLAGWRKEDMNEYWMVQLNLAIIPTIIIAIVLGLNAHFRIWIPKRFNRGKAKTVTPVEVTLGEMAAIKNKEPGVHFGGARIVQRGNKIVVWTAITLLDKNGSERHVEGISTSNFKIAETYNGKTRIVDDLDKAYEVTKKPRSVFAGLLIDNSGSMDNESGVLDAGSRKISKTTIAKRAANAFIDALEVDGTRIIVLPFGGDHVIDGNFLSTGDSIWWERSQTKELKAKIKGLRPKGDTPLWEALSNTLDKFRYMSDEQYKVIVCLTDGMNNKGDILFPELLEKAESRHIPIYTLGYGKAGDLNENELMILSAKTGAGISEVGSYMQLHPEKWASTFERIQMNFAHLYEIAWVPSFPKEGARVNVKLSVDFLSQGERHKKGLDLFYTYSEIDKLNMGQLKAVGKQ